MQVKDIVREDDGDSQELVLTLVASAEDIDGADVIYIDEPKFNVDETVEPGKPFSFTVSGKVAPVMKLTSYDPVAIEMPPEEATEAEIAEQLAELQDYYHHFEDIDDPDHEAQMGEYVQVEVTVSTNGHLVSGMNQTQRLVGLGKGSMPPSFDEHLVGAKVDDTLEFDFEAFDEEGNPTLGDGNLHANVVVKGIRRYVVPPIDDELAVKVGCTDVEDLRKQMRHEGAGADRGRAPRQHRLRHGGDVHRARHGDHRRGHRQDIRGRRLRREGPEALRLGGRQPHGEHPQDVPPAQGHVVAGRQRRRHRRGRRGQRDRGSLRHGSRIRYQSRPRHAGGVLF